MLFPFVEDGIEYCEGNVNPSRNILQAATNTIFDELLVTSSVDRVPITLQPRLDMGKQISLGFSNRQRSLTRVQKFEVLFNSEVLDKASDEAANTVTSMFETSNELTVVGDVAAAVHEVVLNKHGHN